MTKRLNQTHALCRVCASNCSINRSIVAEIATVPLRRNLLCNRPQPFRLESLDPRQPRLEACQFVTRAYTGCAGTLLAVANPESSTIRRIEAYPWSMKTARYFARAYAQSPPVSVTCPLIQRQNSRELDRASASLHLRAGQLHAAGIDPRRTGCRSVEERAQPRTPFRTRTRYRAVANERVAHLDHVAFGTVSPIASASRVAINSFASTRRCCGLF